MKDRFFVVLIHPTTNAPLMLSVDEENERGVLFDSEMDADEAMAKHSAATAWGYAVYPWPFSEGETK